jgi:GT2 family glycosyltransferase
MSGPTSIVIPCHDNLLYTALCLESIARHTPEPHEVVVVDNGCTDATAEWSATRGARVVRSPFNRGFAGGVNLGLAAAAGDVAVILNNDALATPGWLAGLRGALAREPRAGIAGPRSNWVSDDQIIPSPPYDEAPSVALDRFAAARARELRGSGREATRLSGLCMAIARPVLERVGGFDTRFAVGNLEDDDYGLRSRLAGFRLWIADDSYVHHFGHRTFAIIDEDYDALLAENAARYALKWDLPLDRDPRGLLPPRGWDPARDRLPLPPAGASSRVSARR